MTDSATTSSPPEASPAPGSTREPWRVRDLWRAPKWRLFWLVFLLSLVADQVTKLWARIALPVYPPGCVGDGHVVDAIATGHCRGQNVSVISDLWDWRLSMNPGSAFGMFSNQSFARVALSIVGIGIVAMMLWTLHKARPDQKLLHWALALLVGGAIGNLIDRIYFGFVTDFVVWRYKTHEWPVFNIADVVLVVGIGFWFIDIWREGRREKATKKAAREERRKRAKAAGLVKNLTE